MKSQKSKLDQFAGQIAEWGQANRTLAEMQSDLAGLGCSVSVSRLSRFCEQLRDAELQSRLLASITSGARQCREVEQAFGKEPPPELDTLIKLHRVLILKLSTQAQADPSLLEAAGALTKLAMDHAKLGIKSQELELSREKFEHLKAREDQTKAVLEQPLSDAEKAARIKEIYGLA